MKFFGSLTYFQDLFNFCASAVFFCVCFYVFGHPLCVVIKVRPLSDHGVSIYLVKTFYSLDRGWWVCGVRAFRRFRLRQCHAIEKAPLLT